MTRRYSLPFKTAAATDIELGGWHYSLGGEDWIRLEDGVPRWDYLSQLSFHRELTVDGSAIRSTCELKKEAPLVLAVTAHCPAARFRRVLFRQEVTGGKQTYGARVDVPSASVAGNIRLETEILLVEEPRIESRFSPKYAGSRVFRDSTSVDIEGTRSRMPMQIARFSEQFAWLNSPNAPWYVDCGTGELHTPVMHDLRVYLNADQPQFIEAANRCDATLISLLKADIAKRILENALADDSFVHGSSDFDEGTMGEAAMRILRLCFDDMAAPEVLSLAKSSSAKFEAIIRSRFNSPP